MHVFTLGAQAEFKQEWGGRAYQLLSKNCNHFCDAVAKRLDKEGSVKRVPAWVNRLAVLIGAMLAVASLTQRCVDSILKCCSWRRYSHLGGSLPAMATEGASTAGANTLSERGSQQQSVRTRTDAGAGSFPHKFPDSGDHERELCALEESELLRRAKAIGVPQTECALALDSSTPKRRIVALIISAEEKAATVATGTAENESLNESLEVSV